MGPHGLKLTILQLEEANDIGNNSKLDLTQKFALDIGAVKLVDSGGLGSLVALLKNITNHQGKLALVGMNKSVRMMFELSRMDRQFSLLEDMPKAVAFLQQA